MHSVSDAVRFSGVATVNVFSSVNRNDAKRYWVNIFTADALNG